MIVQCYNPQQAHAAIMAQVWPLLKSMLIAGHKMILTLSEESKTRGQEKLYHALIGDIAKQAQHLGAKWEHEDWKRLLIDKFARETGRTHGKIIPNLDSNGVVEVGLLSRKFTKKTANEFVEWLYAWAADNGIDFAEHVDAETGEIT